MPNHPCSNTVRQLDRRYVNIKAFKIQNKGFRNNKVKKGIPKACFNREVELTLDIKKDQMTCNLSK